MKFSIFDPCLARPLHTGVDGGTVVGWTTGGQRLAACVQVSVSQWEMISLKQWHLFMSECHLAWRLIGWIQLGLGSLRFTSTLLLTMKYNEHVCSKNPPWSRHQPSMHLSTPKKHTAYETKGSPCPQKDQRNQTSLRSTVRTAPHRAAVSGSVVRRCSGSDLVDVRRDRCPTS